MINTPKQETSFQATEKTKDTLIDSILYEEALNRLHNHPDDTGIPMETVMSELGISQEELEQMDDVEIE